MQLLKEESGFPKKRNVIKTHLSERGDAIANKFRPTCSRGDSRDETVQRIEERECTERLNADCSLVVSVKAPTSICHGEEFAHTRNVSGFDVERHRNNGLCQEFNDVINSKTPVEQLQQLLTDGRNRVCHSKRTVSNLHRNVGNAGCWVPSEHRLHQWSETFDIVREHHNVPWRKHRRPVTMPLVEKMKEMVSQYLNLACCPKRSMNDNGTVERHFSIRDGVVINGILK